jgi:hypothetical protein
VRDIDKLLERARLGEAAVHSNAELQRRLRALRAWQAARLERTYSDLRDNPRYAQAIAFFLNDLYGPHDLSARDREFDRAWRYLKRALPHGMLDVVGQAIELQALTIELDLQLLSHLAPEAISAASYRAAYRAADHRDERVRQTALVIGIGKQLDRALSRSWLAIALHAAHAPARSIGLATLQGFLERGLSAFRAMGGAGDFLDCIHDRETRLMRTLFDGTEPDGVELLNTAAAKRQA